MAVHCDSKAVIVYNLALKEAMQGGKSYASIFLLFGGSVCRNVQCDINNLELWCVFHTVLNKIMKSASIEYEYSLRYDTTYHFW